MSVDDQNALIKSKSLRDAKALLAMPAVQNKSNKVESKAKAWRHILRRSAAILCLTSLSLTGVAVCAPIIETVFAPSSEVDIRVGRNNHSGRLEVYGTIGARASVRREGAFVIVRLPTPKKPDLGDLRTNLPLGVMAVELRHDARAQELWIQLKDKTGAHFGRSDGAVYVQIDVEKDAKPDKNTIKINLPAQNDANLSHATPIAQNGAQLNQAASVPVVVVDIIASTGQVDMSFPFSGPVGSAVFRRGEAVWIVFDQEVDLRLPDGFKGAGKPNAIVENISWVRNDGVTAMRIQSHSAGVISALSDDLTWRVRMGGAPLVDKVASPINISRDESTGVASLNVNLNGASKIAWIKDPVIGDRLAVVTARGPIKTMTTARTMLQLSLGISAHGVVIEHIAPDVKVNISGDLIEITRPGGLAISTQSSIRNASNGKKVRFEAAIYPSLMDKEAWSKRGDQSFLQLYNQLQDQAAEEQSLGLEGPTIARLSLARFLIGHDMAFEAQGVLELLSRKNPRSNNDPNVRGLKLMAKSLNGRFKDAQVDLESPALLSDPSANLWRGYLAAKEERYADARKAFMAGAVALEKFPPVWRARFATMNALSALHTNDIKSALQIINYAVKQNIAPLEKLDALLVNARIIEASGDTMRAMGVYEEVAKASLGRISTPAQLHATKLRLDLGKLNAKDALAQLDSLRYRWRGDDTELEIIATMGDIYLNAGRYREALDVLKSGGRQFFNRPQALQLNQKLNLAFRGLFLEGMADGLQPIEALGLFYDFKDLTPVGTDGDEMVRRLARRLIDVDLLDQSAQLLEYQVDNRLQGVAKAAVASDLAAIFLMNRQPEKALQTLWKTRTTLLPKPILSDRRVLEARALTELGKPDEALEILGPDQSNDAMDVRAEIFWRQKDWAKAGAALEKQLGMRWKDAGNLNLIDEGRLIRSGVAYSLMADQVSLDRLSQRFSKFISTAQSADAVRVALAGMDNGPLNAQDFALAAAQTDTFAGWVSNMKKKIRERISPTSVKPTAPKAA